MFSSILNAWAFQFSYNSPKSHNFEIEKTGSPLNFFSILYQGSEIRITLHLCKQATATLRSQFSLATSLHWGFPLSTVHPHILFLIYFFNRLTSISTTPKGLHRTAVQITIHLWYGPSVSIGEDWQSIPLVAPPGHVKAVVQLPITRAVSGTEKCFHLMKGQKHYKNKIWFLRKVRFLSNIILSFSFPEKKNKILAQPSPAIPPSVAYT